MSSIRDSMAFLVAFSSSFISLIFQLGKALLCPLSSSLQLHLNQRSSTSLCDRFITLRTKSPIAMLFSSLVSSDGSNLSTCLATSKSFLLRPPSE